MLRLEKRIADLERALPKAPSGPREGGVAELAEWIRRDTGLLGVVMRELAEKEGADDEA